MNGSRRPRGFLARDLVAVIVLLGAHELLGWVSRRTLSTRTLLVLGAAATFLSTLVVGFEIESPVLRVVIVLAGFAPSFAAIFRVNALAKRRREAAGIPTSITRTDSP